MNIQKISSVKAPLVIQSLRDRIKRLEKEKRTLASSIRRKDLIYNNAKKDILTLRFKIMVGDNYFNSYIKPLINYRKIQDLKELRELIIAVIGQEHIDDYEKFLGMKRRNRKKQQAA